MRALLCAFVLLCSAPAFAEKWALLIGINDYEDRNYIASLGAADNDARRLKDVLKSKMGFPDANIELLVSDGDNKPTRSNIIAALGKLRENAKPGDTVFVFYSGHGTEINGVTYLLPHDFKGRNQFTGTETALAIATFKGLLGQVKAKALVMAWDMCRNDPFAKGKSGDAARSKLTDPKAWRVVPDAPVVVNLFACSQGESSFEWQDKNRGYFAWFLEEGMKGAAADSKGNVTLGGLAKYVRTKVMAQTAASEPATQSPTSEMTGASPEDFVLLSTGKPVAGTPTPVEPNVTPEIKTISTKSTLAFKGAPENAKILVDKTNVKGFAFTTDLLEPTQEVTITITAPGYRPKQFTVEMQKGATINLTVNLEKAEATEPDPMPEPTNNTNVPPPQAGTAGEAAQNILRAHNTTALFKLPAIQIVGSGQEKADLIGKLDDYKQLVLVQHPATAKFRLEFTTKTKAIKAGYDTKAVWKRDPRPVAGVTAGEMYQLNPNQMLWYVLKSLPTWTLGKFNKDKKGGMSLEGSDPRLENARMVLTLTPDSLIQRIQLYLGNEEMSFSYDNYKAFEGVAIPLNFRFVLSSGGSRGTQYIYTGERITRSSFSSDGYFAGGY